MPQEYYKPGSYPYTLGRGIMRVRKNADADWQDLFHVKDVKINLTTEELEHENVRSGLKRVDKTVITKAKAAGSFMVDVPASANILMFLLGDQVEEETQAAGTWTAEEFTVATVGRVKELGKRRLTITALTDDATPTPNPFVEGTDYYLDTVRGLFTAIPGGALEDGDKILVTGTYADETFKRVKAGRTPKLQVHVWFAGDPAEGKIQDAKGWAILKPNGDLPLISDEWQGFTFDMTFNEHATYGPLGVMWEDLGEVE